MAESSGPPLTPGDEEGQARRQALAQLIAERTVAALTMAEVELMTTGKLIPATWHALAGLTLPDGELLDLLRRVPADQRGALPTALILARQGKVPDAEILIPELHTLTLQGLNAQLLLPDVKTVHAALNWTGTPRVNIGTLTRVIGVLTVEDASAAWHAALARSVQTFSAMRPPLESARPDREALLSAYEQMMQTLPQDSRPGMIEDMLRLVRPLPQNLLADFAARLNLQEHPALILSVRNAASRRRQAGS